MQTLLVTGGCGFIGSNFIRYQLERYPDVRIINVDALTYAGNPENLSDVESDPRYVFFKGDICKGDIGDGGVFSRFIFSRVFSELRPDAVLNFAAESHVDRSILDSGPFVRTNVLGTQTLLDLCRKYEVARYVQISTDEVYGSLPLDGGFFTEETPLAPSSPYSASKAAADLLVQAYHRTFGFPAIITRCSNNYGPFQFPEKIIPLFIANALADKPLPVYGQGENVRDWIHVRDHCIGIDAALREGRVGEVYNFGGRCELKNIDLTRKILSALGKPESLIQYVTDRPGHDLRYAIDCSKAERELGWTPRVSFEQGLSETIDWYKSHTEWVERVQTGAYRQYYEDQYGKRLSE
jgi:dTDP-glucose 4,6-dehydratase